MKKLAEDLAEVMALFGGMIQGSTDEKEAKSKRTEREMLRLFKPTITLGFWGSTVTLEMRDMSLTDSQLNDIGL